MVGVLWGVCCGVCDVVSVRGGCAVVGVMWWVCCGGRAVVAVVGVLW